MGAWPRLVEEWLFDAVQAKLSDPRRRKQLRYRCAEGGHVTRSAAPIDDLVLKAVRARLAKPDLRNLLAKPASKEARKAADEIRQLRGRLEQTRLDYDNDLIDGARYKTKTAKLQGRDGGAGGFGHAASPSAPGLTWGDAAVSSAGIGGWCLLGGPWQVRRTSAAPGQLSDGGECQEQRTTREDACEQRNPRSDRT
jgi:hypothetical protein